MKFNDRPSDDDLSWLDWKERADIAGDIQPALELPRALRESLLPPCALDTGD